MMTMNIVMMMKIIFFKWYDLYKKRKAQKASIKKDLTPIAWHGSRWRDWCMSEDETRDTEAFWA